MILHKGPGGREAVPRVCPRHTPEPTVQMNKPRNNDATIPLGVG